MKKEMTIVYDVHDGLYINLTNRCPCACTFCLRQTMDTVGKSGGLWLEHEPSIEEVKKAIDGVDLHRYAEVVFCGFGEPLCGKLWTVDLRDMSTFLIDL